MHTGYDNIANIYDRLVWLIYGDKLAEPQLFLLQGINPGSHILIVGGGTGWILEEISKAHPSGLRITYIDVSAKMIALSRKRDVGKNSITFINASIESAALENQYDIILTPFLFDNFTQQSADIVLARLNASLRKGGIWLYADFQLIKKSGLWQKALLKIMYVFFNVACSIETSSLPEITPFFDSHSYRLVSEKEYMRHFVCAKIYQRL